MRATERLTVCAGLATLFGVTGCEKTVDPAVQGLANFSQVTWVGTVGTAKAELTFAPSSPSAVKATLVFLERDEPTVEESLEGHMVRASAFELHGTAVKSLVGEGAPEPHIIDLGTVADGALAGRMHTATTKDYPLRAIFKPGTSVTKLPTIDVARATSRLLEVRWEGKLEGGKPLSLDTRREGAKLAGVLTSGETITHGFVTVTRIGKFLFGSPPAPGGGKLQTVSCQGVIGDALDAITGDCEFSARAGFVTQSETRSFSLRPSAGPSPASTARAAASAGATTTATPSATSTGR